MLDLRFVVSYVERAIHHLIIPSTPKRSIDEEKAEEKASAEQKREAHIAKRKTRSAKRKAQDARGRPSLRVRLSGLGIGEDISYCPRLLRSSPKKIRQVKPFAGAPNTSGAPQ